MMATMESTAMTAVLRGRRNGSQRHRDGLPPRAGHLSPVSGDIIQEIIDVLAVLNALRAAFPPKVIHDL
jgi:hypothetical protein